MENTKSSPPEREDAVVLGVSLIKTTCNESTMKQCVYVLLCVYAPVMSVDSVCEFINQPRTVNARMRVWI